MSSVAKGRHVVERGLNPAAKLIGTRAAIDFPALNLAVALEAQDRLETLAGSPGPEAAARRRVQRLAADAAVDPERLRGWTLFRVVEAGLWSLDVGDTRHASLFLEFAAML